MTPDHSTRPRRDVGDRRNVVLVTVDSLRADHCGYVTDADTALAPPVDREGSGSFTPTLDALAADGVAFTDAVAPGPKTPESMPAIFTGRHQPPGDGGGDGGVDSWERIVRPHVRAHRPVPERFAARGYATVGFSPNGFSSSYFGFDAGFDRFEDFLDADVRPDKRVPGPVRGALKWLNREGNWKHWEAYYDDVLAAVRRAGEPYFLWVFLMDVHSPYLPPRSHRRGSWSGMVYANLRADAAGSAAGVGDRLERLYADAVRYADDCLARLRRELPGDPVFCVHADHGEAFGEHGTWGHERTLYRENLHVPFVLGNVPDDRTVDGPTSLLALPSLLETAATGDLATTLEALDRPRPVVAASGEGDRVAVRFGDHKLVRSTDGDALYDLAADPDEHRDRAADRPAVRQSLARLADRHRATEREVRVMRSRAGTLPNDGG